MNLAPDVLDDNLGNCVWPVKSSLVYGVRGLTLVR